MSHPGHLHTPLHMYGPENGVCNYLALEKINCRLIILIRTFSPQNYKVCGGGGGGITGTQDPPGYAPVGRN